MKLTHLRRIMYCMSFIWCFVLQAGFFTAAEGVGVLQVVDLGAAYIGYIVLGNLSIKLNTVQPF